MRAEKTEMSKDEDRMVDLDGVTTGGGGGVAHGASSNNTLSCLLSCPDQVLEDVLENVLVFLTSRRDRNSAITRSELFIGNCYVVSPCRVIERFRRVRSLVLKGKPRFADFSLVPPNWGAYFFPWVSAMASAYPWLEKVYLKRMLVTDDDLNLLASSFPGFKELVLVCCDGQLRVLDLIDDDVMVDEVDWISCFPETGTCLESLSFDCVEWLFPSLRSLKLNRHVSLGQLHRLMAPQLTHLGTGSFGLLEHPEQEVQEASLFQAFATCKSLTFCARLTSLNLSYANINTFWALDSVCDERLQAVVATYKELRELRVFPMDAREDGEALVSEVGLSAISEGCSICTNP
ncbi:hypothetical protein NE237_027665 [Protea cynaroides]|uniref:F-box protein n=1 Tax=Protea cynaroides TaxID=273540 RepID=A0A9Q0GNE9_9MAGN|nr:hypothetical protein NE237_027665 [Protea cynaroides]